MRTFVYVDGFNLYYGMLKGRPYKWLDLKALAIQLVPPKYVIERIKYFTARVSGILDVDAPRRQATYLKALKTLPEVELHFGNFLAKDIWRPLINLPIAGETIQTPTPIVLPQGNHPITTGRTPMTLPVATYPVAGMSRSSIAAKPLADAVIASVHTMEEKGSDVNLAVHLVHDANNKLFDAAVVISNDTDLCTAIKIVTKEIHKTVILGCPNKDGASSRLRQVATYVRHIRPGMLARAQFPDPVPTGQISKPSTW